VRLGLKPLLAAAAGLVTVLACGATYGMQATAQEHATAAATQTRELTSARTSAQTVLSDLRVAGGPNYQGYYDHQVQLGRASSPAAVKSLAGSWRQEDDRLRATQDQLTKVSGGLVEGLPKDVVDGTNHLRELRDSANTAPVATDPADTAIVDAQLYLALASTQELATHDAILNELNGATAAVQKRLDTRKQAVDKLDQASGLLDNLKRVGGADDGYGGRLGQASAALSGSRTDDQLASINGTLTGLVGDIQAAKAKRLRDLAASTSTTAPTTACISGAPAQLIMIHLATQQLVAYDSGCPWLQAPVTTGRAALPTDRGTFHIFLKAPQWKMVSMWPKGSPFWYPDTWVYNAMEFVNDGTFIHSANWQPVSSYGPGSQNGPYASHGCVHVQDGPLQKLYNWAAIGTTVVVGD
jgi:lipoprotein-anchoring transpeptidase ErfK/SrfK